MEGARKGDRRMNGTDALALARTINEHHLEAAQDERKAALASLGKLLGGSLGQIVRSETESGRQLERSARAIAGNARAVTDAFHRLQEANADIAAIQRAASILDSAAKRSRRNEAEGTHRLLPAWAGYSDEARNAKIALAKTCADAERIGNQHGTTVRKVSVEVLSALLPDMDGRQREFWQAETRASLTDEDLRNAAFIGWPTAEPPETLDTWAADVRPVNPALQERITQPQGAANHEHQRKPEPRTEEAGLHPADAAHRNAG